ncbi:MAG: SDR family NAD(P)-dependent oxidoreductase, partial [Ideonella sp.]
MSDAEFAGQIALVTGASRGIGRAIAMQLLAKGATVIGTATTEVGAQAIGEALQAAVPGASRGLRLDVTDAAAVEAAMDELLKMHGGLHVLVNNAGITRDTL